jgi:hypothetical protein
MTIKRMIPIPSKSATIPTTIPIITKFQLKTQTKVN